MAHLTRLRLSAGVALGFGALLLAAAVTSLVLPSPKPASDVAPCNGSVRLCDLRLDQVALATTHNSTNAGADAFLFPSQEEGIDAQLQNGVRGLLVDAFIGSVRTVDGEEIVYTELKGSRLDRMVKAAGSEPAHRALSLRAAAGPPRPGAPRDVYACHEFCELGATPFSDVVDVLRRFLVEHPNDVLVVVIQDELSADELSPVLGVLDPYIARIDPSAPLPTLGSMVESGRRLVIGLEHGSLGSAIPNVYADGLMQEVPYRYRSVAQLEGPASCRPNRGQADAPLFLLNNWVSPASPESATAANAEDLLLRRADRCSAERGQQANLVAVDFYRTGDLFGVVGVLNDAATGGD
jgi:hypothetical protein